MSNYEDIDVEILTAATSDHDGIPLDAGFVRSAWQAFSTDMSASWMALPDDSREQLRCLLYGSSFLRDAEKARADAAEQRVCELRASLAAIAAPEVDGATTPATLWMERKALAALASTADIAGRWVSREVHGQLVERADVASAAYDRACQQRDAAIARATDADEACALHRENYLTAIARAEKAEAVNAENAREAEEVCRDAIALLESDRKRADAAERARDEVGVQLAAAQAEIARMRPVVEAARETTTTRAGEMLPVLNRIYLALAALDTVPGDALATGNVKGGE